MVRIDAATQLFGVIGNPVRHSLGPILHNGAFREMGLNAAYLAFEVQDLARAMEGIRGLGIRGMSVTIPFKSAVIPYLDELEEVAGRIGAVNTIARRNERLIGYNTDWSAAIEALEEKVPLAGKNVLLLGAGGAARAVAFGLKERGARVSICNRTPQKAAGLARELGFVHLLPADLKRVEAEVLVNATSAGMSPRAEETPVPREALKEGMIVMDIVYRPLKTRLLREAGERGCRTVDGLEMFARQAAGQLTIWTGRRPDVEKIRKDLMRSDFLEDAKS
ncbi:MAG: shikimate dehydrogenase [Deltaproteobacteria bacterium]|nr:shikimate dehydrogenase [Deltaproteobacteria bacterium]